MASVYNGLVIGKCKSVEGCPVYRAKRCAVHDKQFMHGWRGRLFRDQQAEIEKANLTGGRNCKTDARFIVTQATVQK